MTKKQGIIMFAGLLAFAAIAYLMVSGVTKGFDDTVRQWFYSLRTQRLTTAVTALTYLGNWQTIALICVGLLFVGRTRRKYGYPVALSAIFVTALNKGVKLIFARPRPDVSLHLVQESGFSFTSGHSITSVVVYGLLIYLIQHQVKNKTTANVLTAVLVIPLIGIGLSRIYLGVHYPTDVLGGWCLGLAVLMGAIAVNNKLNKHAPRVSVKKDTL